MNQSSPSRRAGILLHISSLPSGDLGADAKKMVDFLHDAGATVWQTLPLNMTHADGSPYQCLSAHAGNPNFISLKSLVDDGWLTSDEAANKKRTRTDLFQQALQNLKQDKTGVAAFKTFCKKTAWLEDFSLFLVLRNYFNQAGWNSWPDAYKNRNTEALAQFKKAHVAEIEQVQFQQFVFFKQWHALKAYANSKHVLLFGDIPIFVAYDSADVWAHPKQFKLDEQGNMTVVAGVPPDYFSATGQRWGNPHYDWETMQADGFAWWLNRMQTQSELFDLVRIDHFRGLEAAWEIPETEPTAMNGQWQTAPGDALLGAITRQLPHMTLVAEDLGVITDEVNALRLKYDLPSMKILQFAFDGSPNNPYLPEMINENSVVYTGTHDNDTSLGWFLSMTEEQRQPLLNYLNQASVEMPDALVSMALQTKAKLAIIPMQDVLRLDSSHRMNIPGTIEGNWQWKFTWRQLTKEMKNTLAKGIQASQRSVSH